MSIGAKIDITVEEQGDHYAVRQEVNGSGRELIAALASLSGATAELLRKAGVPGGVILTKLADAVFYGAFVSKPVSGTSITVDIGKIEEMLGVE